MKNSRMEGFCTPARARKWIFFYCKKKEGEQRSRRLHKRSEALALWCGQTWQPLTRPDEHHDPAKGRLNEASEQQWRPCTIRIAAICRQRRPLFTCQVSPNDAPSIPSPSELTGSRNFRLADLVTIMNGFCGSFSLFSSANYLITSDDYYLRNALLFPLAGLIFDFLDGKVARWRKSSSMLGQELDSLADLVCLSPYVFTSPFTS